MSEASAGAEGETRPVVLVAASYLPSLVRFRAELLAEMRLGGWDVVCAAPALEDDPELDAQIRAELDAMGCRLETVRMARTGMNPARDLITVLDFVRLLRRYRASLFFGYTLKPMLYGALAARLVGVPRGVLVTGLGQMFAEEGGAVRRALRGSIVRSLRIALKGARAVVFQNPDDRALFGELGVIDEGTLTPLVGGSGVDLSRYRPRAPSMKSPARVTFLLVARIMEAKGVGLFVEAARALAAEGRKARFALVGQVGLNPEASLVERVRRAHDEGLVDFVGEVRDVRPELERADVFVLPSFYREGVPRSLIEALACALPVITTDSPGCRETVIDGDNGYLIPPRDLDALVGAMRECIDHRERLAAMGARSRELAETRFDVHAVNATIIDSITTPRTGGVREGSPR